MARIKRDGPGLRDQLTQAIAGITGAGPSWPAGAPTVATVTTARDNLATSITDTDAKEDAWKVAGQLKVTRIAAGADIMVKIDEFTDALYTPSGAEKNNFGLPPKGAPIEPLHKLVTLVLTDGPVPGSLKFDWETIEGAAYEVQWSTVSTFATVVGSATSASASDYVISGLVSGTQYWCRVRPVRGGQSAEWSDPATRVAPV
ncbi:MAG: fibronectin type III domain-containing protein [Fimbriimonadaceae bacterium]|nr:fibronectin type III domain-containing protein [Fimbriimonadaceae bacterium]